MAPGPGNHAQTEARAAQSALVSCSSGTSWAVELALTANALPCVIRNSCFRLMRQCVALDAAVGLHVLGLAGWGRIAIAASIRGWIVDSRLPIITNFCPK